VENKTADPEGGWAKFTAWRVGSGNGGPDTVLVMAEDTTENRHSEERLRQAERLEAVGRLASGVAHDFNNLLTGVLLYCDLLLNGLESGNRVRKYAEEIRAASLQATGLVRQLLALARPRYATPRPISLNEVAEGMRTLLLPLIGENIGLDFHLDPGLGLVNMDPAQVQQIVLNLVLNSRDAMPEGGQITVETRNCSVQIVSENRSAGSAAASLPCALLVVRDDGKGMDAETRKHLFEAFFTTKGAGKGTGLGLATVHDIVTGHGGLVHVESSPGCGARVTVLLPLIPDTALHSVCAGNLVEAAGSQPVPSFQEKDVMP
jgi:signal transduction histidine kinase